MLLLNMEIDDYVKNVYGSREMVGKRFSEVKNVSLAAAEKLLSGPNL